jgi:hypothetical protein
MSSYKNQNNMLICLMIALKKNKSYIRLLFFVSNSFIITYKTIKQVKIFKDIIDYRKKCLHLSNNYSVDKL